MTDSQAFRDLFSAVVERQNAGVDGRATLVSSQNWSSAGVLLNRDAGVILESETVAACFARLFEHVWARLARRRSTDTS